MPATLSITLVDVNDPPVAKNDTKPITATTTTTIIVTANDFSGPAVSGVTSEPGDTVNVTAATGASRGSCRSPPTARAWSTTRAAA